MARGRFAVRAVLQSQTYFLSHVTGLCVKFFVKHFDGRPHYHEKREFTEKPQAGKGRKIAVMFNDGPVFIGVAEAMADQVGVGRKPRLILCSPCAPGSKMRRPWRMQ